MMKRIPRMLAALSLAAALGLAGCGENPAGSGSGATPADDDWSAIDLDKEYGGLTATDEPVAFADPFLEAALAEDAAGEAGDPVALDPEVRALEAAADSTGDPGMPRPRFTFLRVTWGMLDSPADSLGAAAEGIESLDWSGSLRIDRGVVVVRRLILFERPGDHLLLPRPDRRTVGWVSRTGRHYDGIVVEIIEPPVRPDSTGTLPPPNRLHFRTAPFAASFDVAELAGLERTFPVPPEGNAVRFSGFGLSAPAACPKGFLGGRWVATGDSTGVFKGRWMTLHGRLAGLMRGVWGYNDAGERVFVGKWIDRDGRFRGLLRGAWEPGAELGHGGFRGRWVNAAQTLEGVLGGEYVALPERPGGFYAGRWSALCDPEAVGQID